MSSISRLAIVCFALALTACAEDSHTGPPTEDHTDEVVPAPRPLPDRDLAPPPNEDAPYDDVVELLFQNRLSRPVYELYVAPTESNTWGPDLLGRRVLLAGASTSFQSERCDAYYDVLAVGANSVQIARKNRIYMRCGTIHTIVLSP
jgi:hypothetical protein